MTFFHLPKAGSRKSAPFLIFLMSLWFLAGLIGLRPALAQETLDSQGMRFLRIPGGSYFLGSPPNEAGRYADEPTPYKVTLGSFYLAATETTNAQYAKFLKATGHPEPVYWQDENLNAPGQPVVGVSWHDAQAFCRWLTEKTGVVHRLPRVGGRGPGWPGPGTIPLGPGTPRRRRSVSGQLLPQ